jgi:D-alanine-D-alanine ligase
MSEKLALSVLCGGQSAEHEISIRSASNVLAAFDPTRYDLSVVYVDAQGVWHRISDVSDFLKQGPQSLVKQKKTDPLSIVFGNRQHPWRSHRYPDRHYRVDCTFPLIHGTYGEDGAMQGLLDLLQIPYVGADTQSSALCMEKDVSKRLLRAANLPTPDWHVLYPSSNLEGLYARLVEQWGESHLFIKPASLGSSIGVTLVHNESEFPEAVKAAFRFDDRILVEPRIHGREIECSVLGNGNPKASLPGEFIHNAEYYSYEAKYISADTKLMAPATLSPAVVAQVQQLAIAAFKALHCTGMARVDFFLKKDGSIMINELNTIPGFTSGSLYPKLWEVSGLSYRDLLDQLVALALERHQKQGQLIRSYMNRP